MISKELIERINYLGKKSKREGLTEEEKKMQAAARKEYLDAMRSRVKKQLESVKIVDGEAHDSANCTCGHGHNTKHNH